MLNAWEKLAPAINAYRARDVVAKTPELDEGAVEAHGRAPRSRRITRRQLRAAALALWFERERVNAWLPEPGFGSDAALTAALEVMKKGAAPFALEAHLAARIESGSPELLRATYLQLAAIEPAQLARAASGSLSRVLGAHVARDPEGARALAAVAEEIVQRETPLSPPGALAYAIRDFGPLLEAKTARVAFARVAAVFSGDAPTGERANVANALDARNTGAQPALEQLQSSIRQWSDENPLSLAVWNAQPSWW